MSNQKKVRGWPRQIRKIDQWFESNQAPNLSLLENGRDIYVKIWIDPWYRLEKRNPPLWYFKLLWERMIELYALWENALQDSPVPYDLQLWLFEQNYIESELVCSPVNKQGELRNNYFRPCEENGSFPSGKFCTGTGWDQEFSWQLAYATHNYYQHLDNLKEPQMEKLRKKGYREESINQGEADEQKVFWKPYDYVWIGRKKE